MPPIYPFTAIVGQERMFRALVLNAVDPRIGGVLIRGERGTAKSTAPRALAALLPQVAVVSDCRFGCDPDRPTTWCTECRERVAQGQTLPVELRPTPFVNLPVSATEDRVVGTLDIEKAIQKGERHFEPGVLAAANRGLLYIDEVNLLDDHVVDLLLDSAAMGMNIVEREGISFSHPARFILVGTMNPEEGDLRPQLLDRFALSVEIQGIREARERVLIMERNLGFESEAEVFCQEWLPQEQALSEKIDRGRTLVGQVKYSPARSAFHRCIERGAARRRSPRRPGDLENCPGARCLRRPLCDHRPGYCPSSRTGAAAPDQARPLPPGRDQYGRSPGSYRTAAWSQLQRRRARRNPARRPPGISG